MGRLHSPLRGEAVEDVPRPIHADQITVVEFRADQWIALIVNFVAGKNLDVRPQFASVNQILSILDFDIYLARPDFGALRVGARERLVQIGMERCVLELSGDLETWFLRI